MIASHQSSLLKDEAALRERAKETEKSGELQRPDDWHAWHVIPGEVEFWHGSANRLHRRLCYRRGRMERGTHVAWSHEPLLCVEGSHHRPDARDRPQGARTFTELTAVNRPSRAEFLEHLADADVLVCRSSVEVDAEAFDVARHLRAVIRAGNGLDNINVTRAEADGVEVS